MEWCLPPKLRPISGNDAFVSDLQRYIAIWRGIATDLELLRDFSSTQLQLVVVGQNFWICSMVRARSSWSRRLFSTSCARSTVIACP